MTFSKNTNKALKEDIIKQYDALEGLNLSLSDRITIISSDVSYRYKLLYSVVKKVVTNTYLDYSPNAMKARETI